MISIVVVVVVDAREKGGRTRNKREEKEDRCRKAHNGISNGGVEHSEKWVHMLLNSVAQQ